MWLLGLGDKFFEGGWMIDETIEDDNEMDEEIDNPNMI